MNSWSAPSETPGDATLPADASPDLKRFADAVFNEGKSLLLVRSDTDALHSISQSLQTLGLARVPQLKVEHFSGHLSAGLLGLINATLADQALSAVMQSKPHKPPQHLCVVHDAECLSQDELLLLQRVIEHFPGWQARLVLLFKTTQDHSEKLQALLQQAGKGLVIWQLHTPAPKPSSAGHHRAIKPWLVGLGSSLVLGAAVIWLRPPTNPTNPANLGTSVSSPATATASQTLLPSSVPADSALAPADPASAVPASPTAAPGSPNVPPESSPASAPPISSTSPQRSEAALPPVPDVAARGHRWLSAQPKDFFVLLHSSHERLLQAQRTMESKPELNNARLLMLNTATGEAPQFVIVTGPFRSEERAQNYKSRQKLPASARIEAVSTLLQRSRSGSKAKP